MILLFIGLLVFFIYLRLFFPGILHIDLAIKIWKLFTYFCKIFQILKIMEKIFISHSQLTNSFLANRMTIQFYKTISVARRANWSFFLNSLFYNKQTASSWWQYTIHSFIYLSNRLTMTKEMTQSENSIFAWIKSPAVTSNFIHIFTHQTMTRISVCECDISILTCFYFVFLRKLSKHTYKILFCFAMLLFVILFRHLYFVGILHLDHAIFFNVSSGIFPFPTFGFEKKAYANFVIFVNHF